MAVEERDQYSGYLTTGHEWNGIKELNRPVPKVIWWFLAATVLFSLLWWVLMPAWPLGSTFTRGLLGVDQRDLVAEDLAAVRATRSGWLLRVEQLPFNDIRADAELMAKVRQSGRTLFADNCALCHGAEGGGGPGFPSLADGAWLWGGDADTIAETLRVGINSDHLDTRISEMLAFGREGILDRNSIADVVAYVRSLSVSEPDADVAAGREIYAENCSACHGDDGSGVADIGAPDLTDGHWIYGGDAQSLLRTVSRGRQGQMPQWESRLSAVQRKMLTLYVLDLGSRRQ